MNEKKYLRKVTREDAKKYINSLNKLRTSKKSKNPKIVVERLNHWKNKLKLM